MTELEGLRERLGLPADAPDSLVLARLADDPELRAELGTSPRPVHPTACVPGPIVLAPTDYIPPRR